jgi:hypothetical protein
MESYKDKFKNDNNFGCLGEVKVKEFFENKGWKFIEKSVGRNSEFDLKLQKPDGKIILVEVKSDQWEYIHNKITNNMVIETSCSGKPSGIKVSKSDLYAYYYPIWKKIYIIEREKLLSLLPEIGHFAYGLGDKQKVNGFLVDRLENGHHFKIFDI